MDEKTERLRDIFMDVAGDATVTETQQDPRGSLATDEGATEERLRAVVETMRERATFRTDLDDDALVRVVSGFYDGDDDAEIAADLGDAADPETVARARVDLHLVTDDDLDAPFDLDVLREALAADPPIPEIADDLDADESTVERYRAVLAAQQDRRTVADRYREEFETILEDRALGERLTADVKETGLEDATEGMETNVSF